MLYRIHLRWSIGISNLVTLVVVVLQLRTLPLEMPLGSTLITSRLLTCLGAPLVVSIVGICSTPVVTGQMANFIALVAFGSTWTIVVVVAFGTQRFRSSVMFLFTRSCSVGTASVLPLVLLLLLLLVIILLSFGFCLTLRKSADFLIHQFSGHFDRLLHCLRL
ncbi:hypothetical protein Tco_0292599 [Tanacetum coccineum]